MKRFLPEQTEVCCFGQLYEGNKCRYHAYAAQDIAANTSAPQMALVTKK